MYIYFTITSCILLVILCVFLQFYIYLTYNLIYFVSINFLTYCIFNRLFRCSNICTNYIWVFTWNKCIRIRTQVYGSINICTHCRSFCPCKGLCKRTCIGSRWQVRIRHRFCMVSSRRRLPLHNKWNDVATYRFTFAVKKHLDLLYRLTINSSFFLRKLTLK